MKKILGCLVLVAFFAACGSSSNNSTNPDITTIDQLPKATDPVEAVASAMVVASGKAIPTTNGYKLNDITSSIFSPTDPTLGNSRSACEMGNVIKNTFNAGAESDKVQCYVAQTYDASDKSMNIYDGNPHVFSLTGAPEEGQTPKHVKMIITKTSGVITAFQMWACTDSKENGGSLMQYIHQTMDGDSIDIEAIGTYSDETNLGSQRTTVTGKLNASGKFIEKTIRTYSKNTTEDNVNQNWSEGLLTQGAADYDYIGYQKGLYQGQGYGNRIFAAGQLTNPTDNDMRNTEFGMGALKAVFDQGGNVDGDAWDANFRSESTNTYVAEAQAGLLPGDTGASIGTPKSSYTELSINFSDVTGASDYECDGVPEKALVIPSNLDTTACAPYTLGYTWINCYGILDNPT